ncbi:MAG: hypothetical protein SOW20_04770 [Berryella intestinalis]|nr:hypothetical protein [Berryella intestinalis]
MKFNELCEDEVSDTEKRTFLVSGETVAVTIRIPKNLKEAVVDQATLSGLSFSAYVRTCLMDNLISRD